MTTGAPEGSAAPTPPDPFPTVSDWLATPRTAATPTMTLSTIGLDGYPSARTVLLSRFDGRRLHFHTDVRSRKVAELTATPRAAVTLVWPEQARQLVVTGDVATVTDREARLAYAARSRYLQVLAWVNDRELAGRTEDERRARWAAFEAESADAGLEAPDTWVGYTIDPVRVLFWQGATDAPSSRRVHERQSDGRWTLERWPG